MAQTVPNLSSAVMRATHILMIRVENVASNEWSPAPRGGVWRVVDLTVTLMEVLKGMTDEQRGSQVRTQVSQWGTGTTRIAGVPGVWSNLPLPTGLQLVAFCYAARNRVEEMLKDPFCELLLPAEDALPDIYLALQIEPQSLAPSPIAAPRGLDLVEVPKSEGLDLADALAQAQPRAASLGQVWSEHIWASYAATILANRENFDLLMQFIEQPDLSYIARAMLLNDVYSQLIATSAVQLHLLERFSIMLFRLLRVPQAAQLCDNIIDVFLPNLLGLTGGYGPRHPVDIFRDYPGEREKAEQVLLNYGGGTSPTNLLHWLRS